MEQLPANERTAVLQRHTKYHAKQGSGIAMTIMGFFSLGVGIFGVIMFIQELSDFATATYFTQWLGYTIAYLIVGGACTPIGIVLLLRGIGNLRVAIPEWVQYLKEVCEKNGVKATGPSVKTVSTKAKTVSRSTAQVEEPAEESQFCVACGAPLKAGAQFCQKCGQKVE